MSVLREIGIIARALDSIANIEFRDIELAQGQYLYPGAGVFCRERGAAADLSVTETCPGA